MPGVSEWLQGQPRRRCQVQVGDERQHGRRVGRARHVRGGCERVVAGCGVVGILDPGAAVDGHVEYESCFQVFEVEVSPPGFRKVDRCERSPLKNGMILSISGASSGAGADNTK